MAFTIEESFACSCRTMVTAVQSNMVGILRRFHIYPSGTAWSEFRSEGPLSHLRRFSAHPFLFSAQSKPESQAEQKGKPVYPTRALSDVTDHRTKKRRRLYTPRRHTHQSVPCMQLRSGKCEPSPGSSPPRLPLKSVNDSQPSEMPSTCEYGTPPAASYASAPQVKPSSVHAAHTWTSRSAMSNPRFLTSSDSAINWEHVKVEPILTSFESRTPLSKTDVGIVLRHVEEDRKRTFSGTSHGGNLSDATESTSSMPNIAPDSRSEDMIREVPTVTYTDSPPDSCSRSANRRNVQHSQNTHKSAPRSKRRSTVSVAGTENSLFDVPKRPKRRGSVELLGEPSIHYSPDLKNNPLSVRERRSVTLSASSVHRTPISSSNEVESGLKYLCTSTNYHLPDFSLLSPPKPRGKRFPEHSPDEEEEDDLSSEKTSSTSYIEVPSWRVLPLSAIQQSLRKSELANKNVPRMSHRRTASVADQAHEPILRTLRAGVIRSPGVLESTSDLISPPDTTLSSSFTGTSVLFPPKPSGSQTDVEDTSDAAYSARHARLEFEEIRRERRCRLRNFELELKHRLEQKERASWVCLNSV
ncbi:unnamed protein product [Dicrocoelium dendriticum]|nr:unnamed protein product [Dicrocoelium dendriticum]